MKSVLTKAATTLPSLAEQKRELEDKYLCAGDTYEPEFIMGKITNYMALYFYAHVTPSELARWVAETNDYVRDYGEPLKSARIKWLKEQATDDMKYCFDFVNTIGCFLLPAFIECSNRKNKISVLEKEIIFFFECDAGYECIKIHLAEIGNSFFKSWALLSHDDESVKRYLSIHSMLVYMAELYDHWHFYEKMRRENSKKSKELNQDGNNLVAA